MIIFYSTCDDLSAIESPQIGRIAGVKPDHSALTFQAGKFNQAVFGGFPVEGNLFYIPGGLLEGIPVIGIEMWIKLSSPITLLQENGRGYLLDSNGIKLFLEKPEVNPPTLSLILGTIRLDADASSFQVGENHHVFFQFHNVYGKTSRLTELFVDGERVENTLDLSYISPSDLYFLADSSGENPSPASIDNLKIRDLRNRGFFSQGAVQEMVEATEPLDLIAPSIPLQAESFTLKAGSFNSSERLISWASPLDNALFDHTIIQRSIDGGNSWQPFRFGRFQTQGWLEDEKIPSQAIVDHFPESGAIYQVASISEAEVSSDFAQASDLGIVISKLNFETAPNTSVAALTNGTRAMMAEVATNGLSFKVTEFSVGSGGYDINNPTQAQPVTPEQTSLDSPVEIESGVYITPVTALEKPSDKSLSILCRLKAEQAVNGLGEIGIFGEVLDPGDSNIPSGTRFLLAIAHFPLQSKMAKSVYLFRVVILF